MELGVSWRRWYVLAVFSLMSLMQVGPPLEVPQAVIWNTWGPIETGAQDAFQWGSADIAMLANWGTVTFLLLVLPLTRMMEVMGREGGARLTSGLEPFLLRAS